MTDVIALSGFSTALNGCGLLVPRPRACVAEDQRGSGLADGGAQRKRPPPKMIDRVERKRGREGDYCSG